MSTRHVGCYFLPIIHCAGRVRLVAERLRPDCVNGEHPPNVPQKAAICYHCFLVGEVVVYDHDTKLCETAFRNSQKSYTKNILLWAHR